MHFDSHYHSLSGEYHRAGTLVLCQASEWELADEPLGPTALCLGLHPWHLKAHGARDLENLHQKLLQFPWAHIGECGLDRHHHSQAHLEVFDLQIQWAKSLRRSLCVHLVGHGSQALKMLQSFDGPVHLHACSLGPVELSLAQKRGYFIGLSPLLQRWGAQRQGEWFNALNIEQILLESDSYDKGFELDLWVKKIAELLHRSPAELWEISDRNWKRVYQARPGGLI